METAVTIAEVAEVCNQILSIVQSSEEVVITADMVKVLESFGSGETDNDLEVVLNDINKKLDYYEYDPDSEQLTGMTYIAKRLDVIDTRLDTEFIAFNDAFSLLLGCASFFVIWTFFKTIFHRLENV